MFVDALDVDEVIAQLRVTEGFSSVEEVAFVPVEDLHEIEGFDEEGAEELRERARAYLAALEEEMTKRRKELEVSDDLADVVAVFDDGVVFLHRRQRDRVADGDGIQALHLDGFVALHDPTGQHLALPDALDDDDADGIDLVMDNKMRCGQVFLPGVTVVFLLREDRTQARES